MKEAAIRDAAFQPLWELAFLLGTDACIDVFIRSVWRIVPDPEDCEFVREPELQIRQFLQTGFLEGDCDDAATLAGSMCYAIGMPCALVAIRTPENAEFSHVFLRTGNGLDIDPIVPADQLPIPVERIAEVMIFPL